MNDFVKTLCTHPLFERLIIAAIFINAVLIGAEVSLPPESAWKSTLVMIDYGFVMLFTVELGLKMMHFRRQFFRDPWRVFDFLVVGVALIPTAGPLAVLRAFRVLRALRMISFLPKLRHVVTGLMGSLHGLGAVGGILGLVFYVASVVATSLFGETHQEWFGSIGASAYSLFQIMTLESWSMGIVRPVMDVHPMAWTFFVPFIVVTTFIVLNLMIAVIVSAMQMENSEAAEEHAQEGRDERQLLLDEIRKLNTKVSSLEETIERLAEHTSANSRPVQAPPAAVPQADQVANNPPAN